MNILVTGGAGYIGSHTVKELVKQKHKVVVYDDLSYGHREAVDKINSDQNIGKAKLVVANLADFNKLNLLMKQEKIEAVIHFAGFIQVKESVEHPELYIYNNVCLGTLLLDAMVKNKVKYIIFSSSAGVYGEPKKVPIKENSSKNPVNTYGLTKLMFEQILERFSIAYDLNYCALRYFNAAGASKNAEIGEDHHPETHIIPLIIQTALGQRDKFTIFGKDYKTKDGTCVRDYIHVEDLADAHIKALKLIKSKKKNFIYNLGLGKGFSNLELVNAIKKVSGVDFKVDYGKRRAGDPAKLIADSSNAKKELKWKPKYDNIEGIIETAYRWHSQHPHGFNDTNDTNKDNQ